MGGELFDVVGFIMTLNVSTLREPLGQALSGYASQYVGLRFQDFSDFVLTPEKSNSARTVVPVHYNGQFVGDMNVIVFRHGDGTGDTKTYALDDLMILERYRHDTKPGRVIPRSKSGVLCEGFFPLFSRTAEGNDILFAASLDELGLVDNRVSFLWRLGQIDSDYTRLLQGELSAKPLIYLTVGLSAQGNRIGDPHCVYFSRSIDDVLQVVGFLGITDTQNPLLPMSQNWIRTG